MAIPPRRAAVIKLLSGQRRALHVNEVASRLEVSARDYGALHRVLDDLCFDGTLMAMSGQRFRMASAARARFGATVEGHLHVHPRGFGFVGSDELEDDIFIPGEAMAGALHGDRVLARVTARTARGMEGTIERVVLRRNPVVPGTLRVRGKNRYLEPDDSRIRGPIVLGRTDASGGGAEEGDAVVARIERFPELAEELPEGRVEKVLGRPGEPKVEIAKILAREGIEEQHPPEAIAEAEQFDDEGLKDALAGREDLTHVPLPTIDPEDARDHDDAVWVERTEDGGYRVFVAIADVSHYVRPGSALDAEACARGNSVYLPDRVIPMLPPALSSNLCSLVPEKIRLCLAVVMELDPQGQVQARRVTQGFMRSVAKLTYPGVARALGLTTEMPRCEAAEALREPLMLMWDLARLLRTRRMRRGALGFDLPEAHVVLDPETGHPITVQPRKRDPGVARAYRLVEELMLLANETVAQMMVEANAPTVFRNHAKPDSDKLARFAAMCSELDVPFDAEDANSPKRLSSFLKKLEAHPRRGVLHMLLMRSMKQAVYDIDNVGHFGLASEAYLHFTSPIRRYPDLLVHRGIKALLSRQHVDRGERATETRRQAAVTASQSERKAMLVEREVVDLYRTIVMLPHVGGVVEGTVVSVVSSGLYVSVDDPFVDVMVPMEALGPEGYELDELGLCLVGLRSGERIALGDRMVLEITDAVVTRRTVYGRRMADPGHGGHRGRPGRGGDKVDREQRRTHDRKRRTEHQQHKKASATTSHEARGKGTKGPSKGKSKSKGKGGKRRGGPGRR